MNRSLDLTKPWPERRKSCAQDTVMSVASSRSAPALQTANQLIACRSIVASSSSMTVTRVATSASTLKKQRTGAKHRRIPPIRVKLAEDFVPNEQSDSDSSCYDSFNEMETGSYKLKYNSLSFEIGVELINKTHLLHLSAHSQEYGF